MKSKFKMLFLFLFINSGMVHASPLPEGFVRLKEIDPSIQQDMRYAGNHNFVGRPIKGYQAAECILTLPAAKALSQVQAELRKSSLSLKVWDCYRPQMASDDFMAWRIDLSQQQMKKEFYPTINKEDVLKLGYVMDKSGHSRGSTLDVTIVPVPTPVQPVYHSGEKLVSCFASYQKRYHDNTIDMGTGHDCFSDLAYPGSRKINARAYAHRQQLAKVMEKYGFEAYSKEWWHFTLRNEPFSSTYFNFEVTD